MFRNRHACAPAGVAGAHAGLWGFGSPDQLGDFDRLTLFRGAGFPRFHHR